MKKFIRRTFINLLQKQGEKVGMVPVKAPENEPQRVSEVERLGLLDKDLDKDRRYTSLAEEAASLTACSQSMLNILGSSTQQCKVSFGMNRMDRLVTAEMPRDITVCQFSLTNPHQPLIIENLLEDERTKPMQNLPGGMPFQFYAGSPLISSRGFSLGTLCVMDETPKTLEHKQLEGLRLLSDQVVTLIEKDHEAQQSKEAVEKPEAEVAETSGRYHSAATILFADFVDFTAKVERLEPGELLATLDTFFRGFDKIVGKHGVRKVKTIGDAYMCVGGVSGQRGNHAKGVCAAALDMVRFVEGVNLQQEVLGKERWEVRIGVHSGSLIAGTMANSFDIWGDAVNIAARLESSSEAGKVQISEKTKDYLEGAGTVTPRGKVTLKGKGEWDTFFLENLE